MKRIFPFLFFLFPSTLGFFEGEGEAKWRLMSFSVYNIASTGYLLQFSLYSSTKAIVVYSQSVWVYSAQSDPPFVEDYTAWKRFEV